LVLATLHTNDAPSAISRLVDIGIEPYLITSTLLAAIAQRLVRKTCTECHGTGKVGVGTCDRCLGSGFYGRVGVFEIMRMTDDLRALAAQRADSVTLYRAAQAGGFRTMMDDGQEKVARGLTTLAELQRVLG
jgi:general secretion pathway protein E